MWDHEKKGRRAGQVIILTLGAGFYADGLTAAAQDAKLAAAPEAKPAVAKGWESTAAAGLTLTRGNSDTLLGNINLLSSRKWWRDEVSFGGSFTYGETESTKTTETLQGFGQYNHLFTERFYGGVRLDGLHDDIADLDYRFTLSPMVGYYIIKKTDTRLSAEAGPAFIYERQGGDERGYISARLAERFEHQLSKTAKVWQSLEFLPQLDKVENYLLIAEVGAEAAMTDRLSLRAVLQNYFDNEPAPGREKNDLKLISSIVYKF